MFLVSFLLAALIGVVLTQDDAIISTNITPTGDVITLENNNTEAVRAFQEALGLSQTTDYDGNVTADATRLVGYDGCLKGQNTKIYSGWQQSWKIMQASKDGDIDFNSAAALEFLGASGLNKDKHDAMNGRLLERS
ncbi:MAG: hypothetical protein Q9207_007605 [Kuettlingeria erythrocarpa]